MRLRRRYAEGDLVREGENMNIGEDSRARALEFLKGLRSSGEAAPSTDTETPTVRRRSAEPAKTSSAPAKARAETAADVPTPSASIEEPAAPTGQSALERAARKLFPNPSWPGKGIESSLPAIGGQYVPAAARGAARVAQGLTSAAQQGFSAGRAERAAEERAAMDRSAALADKARSGIASARAADKAAADRAEAAASAARQAAAEKAKMAASAARRRSAQERMEGEGGIAIIPKRGAEARSSRSSQERSAEEARMQSEGGRYAKGGKVGGASRRADGIAQRGKTKGRIY